MTTAINIGYDRDNSEVVAATPERVGEVLEAIRIKSKQYPVLAMITVVGDPFSQVLEIGIRGDVGWLHYAAGPDGWRSKGTGEGTVSYDYQGSGHDIPGWSEIPYDAVNAGVKEFLRTGGKRPTNVEWVQEA